MNSNGAPAEARSASFTHSHGFAAIARWADLTPRFSLTATAIAYAALGLLFRETMIVTTTVGELGRRSGARIRAARDAVRELESRGVLIPIGRLNDEGRHVGGRNPSGAGYPSQWSVDLDAPVRRHDMTTNDVTKAAAGADLTGARTVGQGGSRCRTRRHETPNKAAAGAEQGGTRCRHPKKIQVDPSTHKSGTQAGGETTHPPVCVCEIDASTPKAPDTDAPEWADRIAKALPPSSRDRPDADRRAIADRIRRERTEPDGATPEEMLAEAEREAERHRAGGSKIAATWPERWANERRYWQGILAARQGGAPSAITPEQFAALPEAMQEHALRWASPWERARLAPERYGNGTPNMLRPDADDPTRVSREDADAERAATKRYLAECRAQRETSPRWSRRPAPPESDSARPPDKANAAGSAVDPPPAVETLQQLRRKAREASAPSATPLQ